MASNNKYKTLKVGRKRIRLYFRKSSLQNSDRKLRSKIVPRKDLSNLGDFLRSRGYEVVFTTGVFDMIHIGHVRYLELAKSLGDVLVVGLNTDKSVRQLKGPNRPVLTEIQRAEMLSFLGSVDYITLFPETTGAESIKKLKPDVYLCVEGSWEGEIETKKEVIAMSEHSGRVYYVPRQEPTVSTTKIVNKISKQIGQELLDELQRAMVQRHQE